MTLMVKVIVTLVLFALAFGVSSLQANERDAGMDQLLYWGIAFGAGYVFFIGG